MSSETSHRIGSTPSKWSERRIIRRLIEKEGETILGTTRRDWVDQIIDKAISESKTDMEVLQQVREERKRRTVWAKKTAPVGETAEEQKRRFEDRDERYRIKREIEDRKWKEIIVERRKWNVLEQKNEKEQRQNKKRTTNL